MPKDSSREEDDIPELAPENIRLTRAAARRLGSVERDTPGTPVRSQSLVSLDTISEDGSPTEKTKRGAKKAMQLSPIKEKGTGNTSRTATPTRMTRRTSALMESPLPIRTTRTSARTQSTEVQNGHTPREVTFNESPEHEKEHTKFPKTPRGTKKGTVSRASDDNAVAKSNGEEMVIAEEAPAAESPQNIASIKMKPLDHDETIAGSQDSSHSPEKTVFPTSWTQSVSGKQSEKPIDAFGIKEREEEAKKLEEQLKEDEKRKKDLMVKQILNDVAEELSSLEEEEDEVDEESNFADDQAMEVPEGEESMDSEEREYLEQNEIPEGGESIGSSDTDTEGDDEEDAADGGEENFIVFSDELVVDDEDTLDMLERKANTPKKNRKRIIQPSDSSEDDEKEEKEEPPAETYKSTPLTKFSGALFTKVHEEAEQQAPAISEDEDVTMISLVSTNGKKKKTPRKVSLSNARNLEEELEPAESTAEETVKNKTPRKSLEALNISSTSREASPKKKSVEKDSPDSPDLIQNTPKSAEAEPAKDDSGSDEEEEAEAPIASSNDSSDEEEEAEAPNVLSNDSSAEEEAKASAEENDDEWEDMEDESDEQKPVETTASGNISDVMALCDDFLRNRNREKVAQKQINMEKRAKRREAKEKKQQRKKELQEKQAELERIKREAQEKKKLEKEAREKQVVKMEANSQAEGKKSKKDKKKAPLETLPVEESPKPEKVKKKKAKEQIPAEVVEMLPKKKKSKKYAAVVEHSVPVVQEVEVEKVKKKKKRQHVEEIQPMPEEVEDHPKEKKKKRANADDQPSKRLPLSFLNQISEPSTSKVKRKRPVDDDPVEVKPPKKPKQVMTSVGMFTVTDSKENPFCVQDANLVRKAKITKQFQRDRKLKRKKRQNIPEPTVIFPQVTVAWTSAGKFHISDYVPERKVVNAGAQTERQEFVVQSLEAKKKNKKASATTVAANPAMSFKETKLYGSGTVRESSTDLMNRKIKKHARN